MVSEAAREKHVEPKNGANSAQKYGSEVKSGKVGGQKAI